MSTSNEEKDPTLCSICDKQFKYVNLMSDTISPIWCLECDQHAHGCLDHNHQFGVCTLPV